MPVRATDRANKLINMTSGLNTPPVPISLRLIVLCHVTEVPRQVRCCVRVLIPVPQAFCSDGECASRIYIRLCALLILCGVTFHLSCFFLIETGYKWITASAYTTLPRYNVSYTDLNHLETCICTRTLNSPVLGFDSWVEILVCMPLTLGHAIVKTLRCLFVIVEARVQAHVNYRKLRDGKIGAETVFSANFLDFPLLISI